MGNRRATELLPVRGFSAADVGRLAAIASVADETPEGKTIKSKAQEATRQTNLSVPDGAEFVPFTAQTRMSGVSLDGREIRKGSVDAIDKYLAQNGTVLPKEVQATVDQIARSGGTPLVVAENFRALGVIYLKDIVKGGMRDRFGQLRAKIGRASCRERE